MFPISKTLVRKREFQFFFSSSFFVFARSSIQLTKHDSRCFVFVGRSLCILKGSNIFFNIFFSFRSKVRRDMDFYGKTEHGVFIYPQHKQKLSPAPPKSLYSQLPIHINHKSKMTPILTKKHKLANKFIISLKNKYSNSNLKSQTKSQIKFTIVLFWNIFLFLISCWYFFF